MVQTRLKVGGYEAWVVVEKERVEHYEIEVDEEENVATCWIASTAGKKFGVWVVNRRTCKFDCVVNLYLDGSYRDGCYLWKNEKKPELMNKFVSGGLGYSFQFGAVDVTEDESLSTQSYEQLGTIEVKIRRITNYKCRRGSESVSKKPQPPENMKVYERAKKSLTHQVVFGKTKELSEKQAKEYGRKSTCKPHEVVVTFIFKYRSLDMLKANEIAPCDPSPEVPSKPRPVSRKRKSEFTEQEEEKPVVEIIDIEDEEDQRREAELEAEIEKIRQARLERKHASKRVKCEPKVEPVFLPGEIIDLTV